MRSAGASLTRRMARRSLEQAAVRADDDEVAAVVAAEQVDARIRAVEDTQPRALPADDQIRIDGAVDQDDVAFIADLGVAHRRHVFETAVAAETAVLDDERNVVDAVVRWQPERAAFIVLDQEQAGQSAHDLLAGLLDHVRVIPEQRRFLLDLEVRLPHLRRRDDLMRPAVETRGDMQAVPVQGGRLVQSVLHPEFHAIAGPAADRRTEIRAVDSDRRRREAGQEIRNAGRDIEIVEFFGAGAAAIEQRWNPERIALLLRSPAAADGQAQRAHR